MTTNLELITFPGPGVLPIWVAGEKGFSTTPPSR